MINVKIKKQQSLGVIIDSKLNYRDHSSKTIEKAKRDWNMIKSLCSRKWSLAVSTLVLLYKTCILPSLLYAASMSREEPQIRHSSTELFRKDSLCFPFRSALLTSSRVRFCDSESFLEIEIVRDTNSKIQLFVNHLWYLRWKHNNNHVISELSQQNATSVEHSVASFQAIKVQSYQNV